MDDLARVQVHGPDEWRIIDVLVERPPGDDDGGGFPIPGDRLDDGGKFDGTQDLARAQGPDVEQTVGMERRRRDRLRGCEQTLALGDPFGLPAVRPTVDQRALNGGNHFDPAWRRRTRSSPRDENVAARTAPAIRVRKRVRGNMTTESGGWQQTRG